jgi:hypothetical protein
MKVINCALILKAEITKQKRIDINKLIKMSKLQYENHRERLFDKRPALDEYIRDLFKTREKNMEYFSSRTFFSKTFSLLKKLAEVNLPLLVNLYAFIQLRNLKQLHYFFLFIN